MSHITWDDIVTKRNAKRLATALFMVVICFAILIFRIGEPFHRILSIGLYLISSAVWIPPIYRNWRRIKKHRHAKFLKRNFGLFVILAVFLFLLWTLSVIFPMDEFNLLLQDKEELDVKLDKDMDHLFSVITSLDKNIDRLAMSGILELEIEDSNPRKSRIVKQEFETILDHILILDEYTQEHRHFYQINLLKYPKLNIKSFSIAYSAYIAKYKAVHDLSLMSSDYVEVLFNENNFLGDNIFLDLKRKRSHPRHLIRLNSGIAYLNFLKLWNQPVKVQKLLNYSQKAYRDMGFAEYAWASSDTLFDDYEKKVFTKWLPVQTRVSNVLGDTKITTRHEYFISYDQVDELSNILKPGDILFQRRNWYVSNVGMPGFWTHAAIYFGSVPKMDAYFENESMNLWGMPLSQHLLLKYPVLYHDLPGMGTIEAVSEGVVLYPINKSLKADYLAAVRPRIPKEDILKSLLWAFDNYGRPYDFDFDFTTDDELVCSELVYKAYLPNKYKRGIRYGLGTSAGRVMVTPHDMVKSFALNYNTSKQQNAFVVFLDGHGPSNSAFFSNVSEFINSYKRSKYTPVNSLTIDNDPNTY